MVPKKGSVGASGDLAPLAHMSCLLIGEGKARHQGELIDAATALKIAGLEPIALAPKEGLALLNGTQASTAFALEGLFHAEDLFAGAITIGAMSVEAALGSRRPFDARIHAVRGQRGQIDAAACYRHLLVDGSEIGMSHHNCEKVQDPYSLRCQPQVMGACLAQIRHAAEVLVCEANAVSDNPLVFADDEEILSGGNFHAEPVAFAADNLALAIAEIGSLSERRMALLIDSRMSGLPAFLVNNGGVNSGFMIAQVTSAALASENKTLAHPGLGGQPAHLRQPGGSRIHGDLRRSPSGGHGGEHPRHSGGGAAGGGTGAGFPRAAVQYRADRAGQGTTAQQRSASTTRTGTSRRTSKRLPSCWAQCELQRPDPGRGAAQPVSLGPPSPLAGEGLGMRGKPLHWRPRDRRK